PPRAGPPPAHRPPRPADGSSTVDTTPTLTGTAGTAPSDLPAVTVKLYAGGTASGTPVQVLSTTAAPSGAWSVDASVLAEGLYTAQAEQSDSAGNVGQSSANAFRI